MSNVKTVTVDVKALAGVFATADDYCHVCALKLAAEMTDVDPSHNWKALVGEACGVDPGGIE